MSGTFDLGGGGDSFPFDAIGDSVTGRIVHIEEQAQTDMATGNAKFWENGQPMKMVQVQLQTTLRDPANPSDEGKRSVYLKGSKKAESRSSMAAVLAAALAATGSTSVAVGGNLTLTYVGDGVPSQRGYNAPKHYSATYAAPSVSLDGQQAPAAAAPPAWAQAPAAPAVAPVVAPQAAPSPDAASLAAFQQWQAEQAATTQS